VSRFILTRKRAIGAGGLAVALGLTLAIAYRYTLPDERRFFVNFSVGMTRNVHVAADDATLEEMSPIERAEQVRDWLLFTVASSSGLSPTEINKSLYDVQMIRHGYMKAVSNFKYGDARSCRLPGNRLVALIPAALGSQGERLDRLIQLADEHHKDTGEIPKTLYVFEYILAPASAGGEQMATLTHATDINGNTLYSSESGYYEARINSIDDLRRFMGQVDDLTYASLKGGLTVGGRKIKGHDYRGIRIEEIAALYESEAKIRTLKQKLKQKIDEFNARWASRLYKTREEKEEINRQYEEESTAMEEELSQMRDAGSFVGGSGFSLEPTFDYEDLVASFDSTIAPAIRSIMPGSRHRIARARAGLAHKSIDALLELLGELAATGESGKRIADLILDFINQTFSYQTARYDGALEGTEAGMVLFYTDLLAKLWAINYLQSAPVADIPDFQPMPEQHFARFYEKELKDLSGTRLWFGPQDKGFQVADDGKSVLFARTATSVYAASSNSLKPGVEAQPNAESAAFLGWWNEHYEEIARYEPEYERLNQLMKWSLAIAWLYQHGEGDKLNFLQGEKVNRGNWFPDWAKQHPQLRFNAWDKIGFYPRGYKGMTTEAMPRLSSESYRRFGQDVYLSGGVSLASEETFANRKPLSTEIDFLVRRSFLDYGRINAVDGELHAFDDIVYSFIDEAGNRALLEAQAGKNTQIRGKYIKLDIKSFERAATMKGDTWQFETQAGSVGLGKLTVKYMRGEYWIAWRALDLNRGQAFARRLNAAGDFKRQFLSRPETQIVVRLSEELTYLVKITGMEQWLEISPMISLNAPLEGGWDMRIEGSSKEEPGFYLSWLKDRDVQERIEEYKYLVLRSVDVEGIGRQFIIEMRSKAPTETVPAYELRINSTSLQGKLKPQTGEVYFLYHDLPASLKNSPTKLVELVEGIRSSAISVHPTPTSDH
jgi:hypothetical protein